MHPMNRRKLLQTLLAGAGGIVAADILTACQRQTGTTTQITYTEIPTGTPTGTEESRASASPDNTPSPATSTPASIPDLVVARNGTPEELVYRALEASGGIQRFVSKDSWVILKPNICNAYHGYEYASTTNPWVVAALVRMCLDAGAKKVQVMDFPFGGSANDAYRTSGIAEQVGAAGGEMVLMSEYKFKDTKISSPISLKKTRVYEDALKADVLINIPIAKHHGLAGLTLGMKNLMGLIWRREEIHWQIGEKLTDLTRLIKPTLTVVDAVRILVENGPTGGNLADVRETNTIIVSPDIVAADSYASSLFGLRPMDLSYIRAASEAGLGRSDVENLRIEEISLGG